MKKTFSSIAVHWPLVVILSLATLVIVIGGYVYYRNEAGHIRKKKYEELAAIAELKVEQIQQWRKERLNDALENAKSPFWRKATAAWLRDPVTSGLDVILQERLLLEQTMNRYSDVLLLDTSGRVLLAALARPDPVDAITKKAIAAALSGRTAVLSDLYRCPRGIIHLDAVAPMLNAEGRPMVIALIRSNAADTLYPLIQSWPTPSRSAEIQLVRRDGDDVLLLNDLRHQANTALVMRIPLSRLDFAAVQAVLGKEGMFQGRDYRGTNVLADLRPVPETPWFIVTKVDTDEIMAEARYRAGVAASFTLLFCILIGGTIIYAYWRRQAAEQRAKEIIYQTIIQTTTDGFCLTDMQGRFLDVNEAYCRMIGYNRNKLLKMSIPDVEAVEEPAETAERIQKIEKSRHDRYESRHRRKDDKIIDVEVSVNYLPTNSGRLFVFIHNITERKRSEERLRKLNEDLVRSNKELEQFAYVASHDLQEPLRMISSYTQLLAKRYEGQLDAKAKKYIDYAVDGAIRMQRLINDLLTYSRAGRSSKPFGHTDSHAALGEVIRNLAGSIAENQAIITNDDLPMLHADASQLVHVFQNLIANAIKFRTEDLPRVHVSVHDQGDEWVFTVEDNGIGIDPRYADRVFMIFQRLHTKQEYPGTGIGLALCKRIVERHGGRIWFESEPEKGSTFYFTIPKNGGQ